MNTNPSFTSFSLQTLNFLFGESIISVSEKGE